MYNKINNIFLITKLTCTYIKQNKLKHLYIKQELNRSMWPCCSRNKWINIHEVDYVYSWCEIYKLIPIYEVDKTAMFLGWTEAKWTKKRKHKSSYSK